VSRPGDAAYLVLYEGRPRDPEAFLRHYVERHVPLLWEFPGIRDVEVGLGRDSDVFMVVRLVFDDLDTLRKAITSTQRARARTDMLENFPPFEGRVHHHVTEVVTTSVDGRLSPGPAP
jgi:uncharacterized protein (TIGR02118 family)